MRILVIDAYSSGRDLVGELRRSCGAEVDVYFQTLPFEPCEEHAGRRPEQRLLDVAARGSYDRIVAGSEPGVSAADWLSSSMNLPCNRPETLWHRRNKVGMIEAAKRAGLRSPVTWRLRRGSDLGPMTDRFQEFRHGVIVKPSGSGGSDSCFICRDESEIEAAVAHVLGSVNLFGNANDEVVVQERIGGEQYFVNTVSEGGRHLVTEMFRYGISESSSTPHIYSAQTIATHDPLYRSGTRYVLDILDSLGVEFAASHTEIRFEDDRWTLIEYNGRSMGPTVPSDIYVPARGFSQVTVLAMMLTQGYEAARALVRRGSPDYGLGWHMPSPRRSGRLRATDWSRLRQLESFVGVADEPEIGTVYDLSNRVTTASAGLLFFSHADSEQVRRDLETSSDLELADAFYRIDQVSTEPAAQLRGAR